MSYFTTWVRVSLSVWDLTIFMIRCNSENDVGNLLMTGCPSGTFYPSPYHIERGLHTLAIMINKCLKLYSSHCMKVRRRNEFCCATYAGHSSLQSTLSHLFSLSKVRIFFFCIPYLVFSMNFYSVFIIVVWLYKIYLAPIKQLWITQNNTLFPPRWPTDHTHYINDYFIEKQYFLPHAILLNWTDSYNSVNEDALCRTIEYFPQNCYVYVMYMPICTSKAHFINAHNQGS